MFSHRYRTVWLLALCLGIACQSSAGKGLRASSPKRSIMTGRLVAKVPLEGVTSFGLNYETYIFEIEKGGKDDTGHLIKFSFRFDQRDPRLPKSFFDYSLTHKFRLMRDEGCDETWESISTRILFDRTGNFQGKQNALIYAPNAPVLQFDPQSTLPCYAGTPQDYRHTAPQDGKAHTKTPPSDKPATAAKSSSANAVASVNVGTHKEE